LLRSLTNGEHDTLHVFYHIIVRESEHTVSSGCKPLIAPDIVAQTRFEIMALAIDLNNKLAGVRDEVGYVSAYRTLPSKPEPGKAMGFQMTPQQCFRARHGAS
jgi:hypothetical protein